MLVMSEVPLTTPKIFNQIIAIMGELDAIGKARSNSQGAGFKYRGIDDVYNALHALLAKHGVFTVPQVQSMKREERQSKAGGPAQLHHPYNRLRVFTPRTAQASRRP
jgi:hypothetical protein